MVYTSLNVRIYVPDFDQDSCRLGSTVLLFRDNNTMLLFLFLLRTSQPCSNDTIANPIAFASTVLNLPLGCGKLVCFCNKFILCSSCWKNYDLQCNCATPLAPSTGTTQRSIEILRGSATRLNKPRYCSSQL